MRPGSYVTRMAADVVSIADGSDTTLALISVTIAGGTTAILIILATGVGLIAPTLLIDRFGERPRWAAPSSPILPCTARHETVQQRKRHRVAVDGLTKRPATVAAWSASRSVSRASRVSSGSNPRAASSRIAALSPL